MQPIVFLFLLEILQQEYMVFQNNQNFYYSYPTYLREVFNERVQKITIDAGFTCPNRDGVKGFGGCTYCNNEAFVPSFSLKKNTIAKQVADGIGFFAHKYNNQKYLAYLQSYSNTYGPLDYLKSIYEEALSNPQIAGLVIGTRPDCVSDELLEYLAELSKTTYIMVEYGVESTLNTTLQAINRGHTYEDAVEAINKTHALGVSTSAHLILGLPGESRQDMLDHAVKISELPITTLKLHQLQIVKQTKMAKQYEEDPSQFHLFSFEEYIDLLCDFIALMRPEIVLERFVSQTPADLLIAPHWGLKNYEFSAKLEKALRLKNIHQGDKYIKKL